MGTHINYQLFAGRKFRRLVSGRGWMDNVKALKLIWCRFPEERRDPHTRKAINPLRDVVKWRYKQTFNGKNAATMITWALCNVYTSSSTKCTKIKFFLTKKKTFFKFNKYFIRFTIRIIFLCDYWKHSVYLIIYYDACRFSTTNFPLTFWLFACISFIKLSMNSTRLLVLVTTEELKPKSLILLFNCFLHHATRILTRIFRGRWCSNLIRAFITLERGDIYTKA